MAKFNILAIVCSVVCIVSRVTGGTTDVLLAHIPSATAAQVHVQTHTRSITVAPGHGRNTSAPSVSNVAICLFTKDQREDLEEWLQHHYSLGISTVYLVDDGTQPPLLPAVAQHILARRLVYVYLTEAHGAYQYSGKPRPQQYSYNLCLRRYAGRHGWMAFIDVDEFLMFTDGSRDLPQHLQQYDQHGGLAVNWWVYGSDNHTSKPMGGVVANYLHCNKEKTVKAILNMACVSENTTFGSSVHHPQGFQDECSIVNEARVAVDGPFSKPLPKPKMFLAHYVLKSWEEFQQKLERGGGVKRHARTPEFFEIMNRNTAGKWCNESLAYTQT